MALIPEVQPKQERKVVSARLDEETNLTLQRYATFLGDAAHEYIQGGILEAPVPARQRIQSLA
jgi:hypothetical protein